MKTLILFALLTLLVSSVAHESCVNRCMGAGGSWQDCQIQCSGFSGPAYR